MLGLVRGGIANAPPDVFAAGNVYHSRQGRELLREGFSLNLKTTRFQRHEVIARPPLGRGTGKNRDVATAVIVKILNTPLTRTVAIFVNRHLTVERTDRWISEVFAALETRHLRWVLGCDNLFERSWPRTTHG